VCLAVEEVDHVQLVGNLRHRYLRLQQPAGAAAEAPAAAGGGEWRVLNVNP